MAESDSGKSELPTPFRLEEARKKGTVVHSPDVSSLGILIGFIVAAMVAGHEVYAAMRLAFRYCLGVGLNSAVVPSTVAVLELVRAAVLAPLCVLMAVALLAALIQHRPVFSAEPLKPDWKKVNPAEGLRRLFSLKSLAQLGLTLLKMLLLGGLAYVVVDGILPEVALAVGHPALLERLLKDLAWRLFAVLIVSFALFALVDYLINRRFYIKQLMMSPRDIKDETRRRDGDPLIKRRIREYRVEMLKKTQSLGNVPDSDFVIVNPAHYAVAIKYNPSVLDAPVVVAKGGGQLAARIRAQARKHQIPLFPRKKLTRALYFKVELGQPVPREHYSEIAFLLKRARKLRRKS